MTLGLMCLLGNSDNVALPPARRHSACPWQTFAHVSEKQLPGGSLLPLELQRLPHFSLFVMILENINSRETGDICLKIMDNKVMTSEHA